MFGTKRVLVFAGALAMILAAGGFAFADAQAFTVPLAPAPGVAYSPSGEAQFILSADGSSLGYTVNVANIHDPTVAVLMQNGQIVAYLGPDQLAPNTTVTIGNGPQTYSSQTFQYGISDSRFSFAGTLGSGVVTASNLVGPLAGKPMTDLVNAINAGQITVAVQSADYSQNALSGMLK